MTINERVKRRRKELMLSVDEVAKAIGKDRATIYRYESSNIENMPVSVISPLAKALQCSPAYLMGWEDKPTGSRTEPDCLPEDEKELMEDYRKLNPTGKEKAKEYVNDLTGNEKYTENLSDKLHGKAIG